MAFESFGDLLFRDSADDLLDNLAVFEDEQGRDAADVVATGGVHRFVDVELRDLELARVVVRDFSDGGGEHVTWAAPLSPEIYQHRLGAAGGENFRFKIRVGYSRDAIVSHVFCP